MKIFYKLNESTIDKLIKNNFIETNKYFTLFC